MLRIRYIDIDGKTAIKISDPDFQSHLRIIKTINGRIYANGEWFVKPTELSKVIDIFGDNEVVYDSPKWKCIGADPPTVEDIYGVPIDEIGRNFLSDEVDKRSFQDIGACFTFYKGRTILADEVGLGKTIEALLLISKGIELGRIRRPGHVLVLTKSGLVYGFAKKTRQMSKLTSTSIMHYNPKKRELQWQQASNYDIIVCGHEKIRIDMDYSYMKNLDLDWIIVDEIHKFNNRGSKLHQQLDKLLSLQSKSGFTGMSATPATGDPIINLYDLMRLIDKNILGKVKDFESEYIKNIKYTKRNGGTFWSKKGIIDKLPKLRKKIAPYILQRSCSDVGLEKPPCYFSSQYVEMIDEQIELSNRAWKEMEYYEDKIAELESKQVPISVDKETHYKIKRQIDILTNKKQSLFTLLRMTADGMGIFKGDTAYSDMIKSVKSWRTPKVTLLEEIIPDMLSESKVVIHTDFMANFPVIIPSLENITKTKILTIDGSSKATCSKQEDFQCGSCDKQNNCTLRRRQEWMFQNDDRFKIILMTSAGQDGLDLQIAKYQVNYDLPWNPSALEQRKGRIHRYGSLHDSLYIVDMISIGSIEEVIIDKVIARKNSEIEKLVNSSKEEAEYIRLLTQQLQR